MEERFEHKYEEQKIPEWYDLYFDYRHIKSIIAQAKLKIKSGQANKIPGYIDINDETNKVTALEIELQNDYSKTGIVHLSISPKSV